MTSLWWVLPGVFIWVGILLLPWRPWSTRERLETEAPAAPADSGPLDSSPVELNDVVALIPARNEATVLGGSLRALGRQGRGLKVVVVDDQSSDDTAGVAARSGIPNLTVVPGRPVPAGWSGKVWALEQGRAHLDRPLTLLLDADVELAHGMLAALRRRLRESGGGMVSVMVELPADGLWSRLLLPAFVYFFKLLYPFGPSASPRSRVAAAAGGCVLCETRLLGDIGGFGMLRGALIDDCRLAALAKRHGYLPWIGLTRSARSTRERDGLAGIWRMVARTAFTQLEYSPLRLALCTLLMVLAFGVPPLVLVRAGPVVAGLAGLALAAMVLTYLPVLRYYRLSPLWALAMPAAGVLFMAMTWDSALGYWRGRRSRWKGRVYARRSGRDSEPDSGSAVA